MRDSRGLESLRGGTTRALEESGRAETLREEGSLYGLPVRVRVPLPFRTGPMVCNAGEFIDLKAESEKSRSVQGRAILVGAGKRMWVSSEAITYDGCAAEAATVWPMLTMIGLGLVGRLRGRLVLHGSAVGTEWGAVLLLGAMGAGKSTVAATMCVRHGCDIISDDLLVMDDESGRVGAGPRVVGLWEEPEERSDRKLELLGPMTRGSGKCLYRCPEYGGMRNEPIAIAILSRIGTRSKVERLGTSDALCAVAALIPFRRWMSGRGYATQLSMAKELIDNVPVFLSIRGTGLASAAGIADYALNTIADAFCARGQG